jgi:hypothetical protein
MKPQESTSTVVADVQAVKNQINDIKTNEIPKAVGSATQRVDEVSKAIIALDTRLGVVEDVTGVNQPPQVQAAESTEVTFEDKYLGFQFVIKSKLGLLAMAGAGLALLAFILSIIALERTRSPPSKTGEDEQVLLEAGGEGDPNGETGVYDPNAEYDPNADPNYDPNADPNAQYYQGTAEEQQQ